MKQKLLKFLILISFMVTGCSLDLKTKEMAKTGLQEQSIVVIENYFDLTYVENHAIAFGILGNLPKNFRVPLILTLTVSATFLMFYMVWKMRNKKFRLLLPLFIILGGAYGNITDRMLHAFVTDFFHAHYFYQYNFPVFNLADVLINIGVFLIIIQWKDFNEIFDEVFSKKTEFIQVKNLFYKIFF